MNNKGNKSGKTLGKEVQSTGKKSKSLNKNIMIQEEEQENETMYTFNQSSFSHTRFSLNNISMNVFSYIAEFMI